MDRLLSNLNGRGFQAVVCLLSDKPTTNASSYTPDNTIATSQRLFLWLTACIRLSHCFKCISSFHLRPDLLAAEGVVVPLIVWISHAFYRLHPAVTDFKLAFDKELFEIQGFRALILFLLCLPVRLTLQTNELLLWNMETKNCWRPTLLDI